MTEEETGDLVERLAAQAIEKVGPAQAPAILWGAFLTAHLRHRPLVAAILSVEDCLVELRQRLAAKVRPKGTIQ